MGLAAATRLRECSFMLDNTPIRSNLHARANVMAISKSQARAATAAIFFLNGFGFATWVSRIPAVRQALNLTEGALGTALLAIAVGALVAFPLAGRGSVIRGARAVTIATGLAYCVVLPGPTFAGGFLMLALLLFLFGAANGAMDVAMNALAVEVETFVGKPIMSSFHGMWSIGGLTGAGVGALFAKQDISPQLHLLIVASVLTVALLVARHWLPPSQPHASPESVAHFALPERAMLGLSGIIFCAFLIEGAMADWSAVLLHDSLKTTAASAALGYAAFSLAMTSMRFAGDRLVIQWGAVRLLRCTNVVGALAFAAALWVQHVGLTMLAFALIGFGMATVAPLVFGAAARRARHGAGHGIAAMATAGYGGFLVGPPLVGWLAQASSLRVALGVLAILALAITALAHHLREPVPDGATGRTSAVPIPGQTAPGPNETQPGLRRADSSSSRTDAR
jgi:MFS family permease